MSMTAVPTCLNEEHDDLHRNPGGGMPGVGWATWEKLMDAMKLETKHDEHDAFDTGHLDAQDVLAVDIHQITDKRLRNHAQALQRDALLVAECNGGRIMLWG